MRWATLIFNPSAWAMFVLRRRRTGQSTQRAQVRRIRINGSYEPSEVHVLAGRPTRLIFSRQETAPCSERVVFPDLGISVMLPAFEDVTVDLPAIAPGEHPFTCQLEMLHGSLIVDASPSDDRAGIEPLTHRS